MFNFNNNQLPKKYMTNLFTAYSQMHSYDSWHADEMREMILFNSALFYKTYRLDLHRQLNTVQLK